MKNVAQIEQFDSIVTALLKYKDILIMAVHSDIFHKFYNAVCSDYALHCISRS